MRARTHALILAAAFTIVFIAANAIAFTIAKRARLDFK
jgi:cbb3-type cytochrome oxidase subunit 3